MTRYALLPTPGDPAVLTFWLHFYKTVWAGLFDGLLVCHNPPPELARHTDYVRSLFDAPGVSITCHGVPMGHGQALWSLVTDGRIGDDDLLAFFEDDAVTFRRDGLARCLDAVEGGQADLVGSPRGSATPELVAAENRRFGGPFQAGEDTGPNFWPNLFVARRSLLRRTDMHFGSYGWEAGRRIPQLDWTPGRPQAGDTMVWMSIQLRALLPGDRIRLVPQRHSSPHDLVHARQGRGVWSSGCEWFHIGSLSSVPLGRDLSGVILGTDDERLEWERRLMYVWLASEEAERLSPGFGLADEYRDWIRGSARRLGLDAGRMRRWMDAYRRRLEGVL